MMRVFQATYGFRQGNMPGNFGTQTSDGIKYGVPGIARNCSPELLGIARKGEMMTLDSHQRGDDERVASEGLRRLLFALRNDRGFAKKTVETEGKNLDLWTHPLTDHERQIGLEEARKTLSGEPTPKVSSSIHEVPPNDDHSDRRDRAGEREEGIEIPEEPVKKESEDLDPEIKKKLLEGLDKKVWEGLDPEFKKKLLEGLDPEFKKKLKEMGFESIEELERDIANKNMFKPLTFADKQHAWLTSPKPSWIIVVLKILAFPLIIILCMFCFPSFLIGWIGILLMVWGGLTQPHTARRSAIPPETAIFFLGL